MERLAADGPEAADAFRRFAHAWDEGQVDPTTLLPAPGPRSGRPRCTSASDSARTWARSSPVAALRPALESYFEGVRDLPDGVWTRGWLPVVRRGARRTAISSRTVAGGSPAISAAAPGSRRGSAARSARAGTRATSCGSWPRMLDEGYFIEACRACHGYLKGVDRRQRWNAGAPARGGLGLAAPRPPCLPRGLLARHALARAPAARPRAGRRGGPRVNAVLYDVALTAYILAAVAAIGSLAGRRDQLAWVALLLHPGGLDLPHRRGDPAGHRAPAPAGLDPRRDGLAADLGRDPPRLLGRAAVGASARSAPSCSRSSWPWASACPPGCASIVARAAGAERLDLGARGAGAGGAGRARAELRGRADVPAGGAPAQGQAPRHRVLSPAPARDARPAHDRHPHRRLPVPHRGPGPRGALGPRRRGAAWSRSTRSPSSRW